MKNDLTYNLREKSSLCCAIICFIYTPWTVNVLQYQSGGGRITSCAEFCDEKQPNKMM